MLGLHKKIGSYLMTYFNFIIPLNNSSEINQLNFSFYYSHFKEICAVKKYQNKQFWLTSSRADIFCFLRSDINKNFCLIDSKLIPFRRVYFKNRFIYLNFDLKITIHLVSQTAFESWYENVVIDNINYDKALYVISSLTPHPFH